jgi:hypothetical protein
MNLFNRRNALVGFITLKMASRWLNRRRRRERSGLRIALFVGLGLVSLGILAGVAAAFLRRRRQEPTRLEGYAVSEDAEEASASEPVTATAEPIPAT